MKTSQNDAFNHKFHQKMTHLAQYYCLSIKFTTPKSVLSKGAAMAAMTAALAAKITPAAIAATTAAAAAAVAVATATAAATTAAAAAAIAATAAATAPRRQQDERYQQYNQIQSNIHKVPNHSSINSYITPRSDILKLQTINQSQIRNVYVLLR